jgi:hypothetical protein
MYKRKSLTPTKIILIAVACVLVVSIAGYCVFWEAKVSSVFDKFDNNYTATPTSPEHKKNSTEYTVTVVKPDITKFVGYVSIKIIDDESNEYEVWMNPDAITNEIIDWNIIIDIVNNDKLYNTKGFRVDDDWRASPYPQGNSGFESGDESPQEYANKYRAEIQNLFDEIERRWGYKLPLDTTNNYG